MKRAVFTYGSLMFAPVWRRVVAGEYNSAPAMLNHHARFAVIGASYPGMLARAGECVRGLLYFDVESDDLAALDRFEGADYRRVAVDARLDGGDMVRAQAYLYLLPARLSGRPWQPERFDMQRFIATYCAMRGSQAERPEP